MYIDYKRLWKKKIGFFFVMNCNNENKIEFVDHDRSYVKIVRNFLSARITNLYDTSKCEVFNYITDGYLQENK